MKILYGIQGTGNGHVSRAREIIPELQKYGKVDILISSNQFDIYLPYPITYRFKGLGFHFGKSGGIDIKTTLKEVQLIRFFKDVRSLPVAQYDVVLSDFEPITAWACRLKQKECIALSHQHAFFSPKTPRPANPESLPEKILQYYAPVSKGYGFHFKKYDDFIFEPIINSRIKNLNPIYDGFNLVYLPAYNWKFIHEVLSQLRGEYWHIYVKGLKKVIKKKNFIFYPAGHPNWINDVEKCNSAILGAGFEGPSEMLYLGKQLMVVPMKNQYEQKCNATALKLLGVAVLERFDSTMVPLINEWLIDAKPIRINYESNIQELVDKLLSDYSTKMTMNSVDISLELFDD